MSESNGTIITAGAGTPKPPPPKAPPTDLKELREGIERKMLENLWWQEYGEFGGSDTVWERVRGFDGSLSMVPPSVFSDRNRGQDWPFWRTEMELALLRNKSRLAASPANAYGQCLVRNLTNAVIGKGFAYKVQTKEKFKPAADDEGQQDGQLDALVEATQDVVDDFLSRNRWNAVADPREDSGANGTREREAFERTLIEGDTFIRMYYLDDENHAGETVVRFMNAEQCWNPPGGTPQDGWTFGTQHATEPFEDVEQIVNYHFLYTVPDFHGPKKGDRGEIVPAMFNFDDTDWDGPRSDIVHIKQFGTYASTKRGLPAFIWDTADALMRASKLQKCISVSSAVRAATAEIWQHATSTQSQVTGLANMLAGGKTTTDPASGVQTPRERIIPGMRRRIPAGQQLVNPPSTAGVTEHLAAAQGDLRQACASFCAPEYMTGDASNNNLASSKEAGTPFVRESESKQEVMKAAFAVCVWRAIKWAVRCGKLRPEVLTMLDLQVEAPTVSTSDPLVATQCNQIKNQAGVLSVQTWQQQDGLDPEIEQANIEEHTERMGPALPMPGMDDNDPNNPAPPVPPPAPRLAVPSREDADGVGDITKGELTALIESALPKPVTLPQVDLTVDEVTETLLRMVG